MLFGIKNGGSVMARFVALWVVCSFIFSSVSFAMPAASIQPELVDNMALESFLANPTQENFEKLQTSRQGFKALLDVLGKTEFTDKDKAELNKMWVDNYKGTGGLQETLEALLAAENFEIKGNDILIKDAEGKPTKSFGRISDVRIEFVNGLTSQIAKMIQRDEKGSRVAQAEGINPKTGRPFASEQEKEDLLRELSAQQAATAKEPATDEDKEIFEQAISKWEAQNETAYQANNITEEQYNAAKIRIAQMRAKNERGNLRFGDAVVLSETVFVLHQNPDVENPDVPAIFARQMKDKANPASKHLPQLVDHESVIEKGLAGHDKQLAPDGEQRKTWGNAAVDTAGPAMRDGIINTKLAEQKKQEAEIEVSFEKTEEGKIKLTDKVLKDIAKKTGTEETLNEKPDEFKEFAQAYVDQVRTATIIQPMVYRAQAYQAKRAARSPFNAVAESELTQALVDHARTGGTIDLYYNGAVTTKDGTVVPNTILAELLEISKYAPTVEKGQPKQFNIIATGNNAQKVKEILDVRNDAAEKWDIIESEESLIRRGVDPSRIAVIHTEQDTTQNLDKVFYLELQSEILEGMANGDVANGIYDSLTIIMAAMNHQMEMLLSADELEAYRNLRNNGGKYQLSPMTVADAEDYRIVHQEYEKFVELFTKA